MENYKIRVSASAEKALKKIPKKDLSKIIKTIEMLSIDPYPQGCRKISGEDDVYRVRKGNYRVLYEINGNELIIIVLKIGHRKNVYEV